MTYVELLTDLAGKLLRGEITKTQGRKALDAFKAAERKQAREEKKRRREEQKNWKVLSTEQVRQALKK